MEKNTQLAFGRKTIIINPVAIKKFFYIICNVVFNSLLTTNQIKSGLLGLILNYFIAGKTNGHSILYLYCLILLRGILYLVILHFQIQDNDKFCQKLLLFLKHIIKYLVCLDFHLEILHHACPNANKSIITS